MTGTVNGVTNPSYLYDANGNMQTDGTRSFTWTSFNMPLVISKTATGSSPGSGSATFAYGAEHQRVKQVWTSGSTTSTTYYLGEFDFEKVVDSTGSTYKHYVKVGDRIVTSITRAPSTSTTIYILPDHLEGTSVVTDSTGVATLRTPYDPWGDRRSGFASTVGASDPTNTLRSPDINRGFTGHEMLDQGNLGLIHMNGRVYDPTLGRFISADPYVQAPYSSQSFNRYTYVRNAPLDGIDPSGFIFQFAYDSSANFFNGTGGLGASFSPNNFIGIRTEVFDYYQREGNVYIYRYTWSRQSLGGGAGLLGSMVPGLIATAFAPGAAEARASSLRSLQAALSRPAPVAIKALDAGPQAAGTPQGGGGCGDLHHICTDKNSKSDKNGGPWTPRFQKIFDEADMSLRDADNLVRLENHAGPHPEEYHQYVYNVLQGATEGLEGGTPEYQAAVRGALRELRQEIMTPGSRLNTLLTK